MSKTDEDAAQKRSASESRIGYYGRAKSSTLASNQKSCTDLCRVTSSEWKVWVPVWVESRTFPSGRRIQRATENVF